ncbi:hypothetical protein HZ994_05065 [Akkermansiaceae bacterium]|nr:hypothetical protein HZ994_05065 [Akkermansiaceae bacterium]
MQTPIPIVPETHLLIAQLVISALMTGVIWHVQLLTYPQFRRLPPESFLPLHDFHCLRMGMLVVLPMLLELGLAALHLIMFRSTPSLLGFIAVALIWASTAFFQAPLHHKLGRRHDHAAMELLIRTNWIRSVLWSARTMLLAYMLSVA